MWLILFKYTIHALVLKYFISSFRAYPSAGRLPGFCPIRVQVAERHAHSLIHPLQILPLEPEPPGSFYEYFNIVTGITMATVSPLVTSFNSSFFPCIY